MTKKCLYSCSETGPVSSADESFICELHISYLKMSASLAPHLLTLTRNLVHDLAGGKKEFKSGACDRSHRNPYRHALSKRMTAKSESAAR
jgi:hypothetical protein